MKKHVGIGIPCSEDRTNMTPTESGAYCQKCAMEVIDFTRMSTDEIKRILYASKGERVCGSMTPALEQTLHGEFYAWQSSQQEQLQRAMIFSLFLIFGLTLFSCSSVEGNRALKNAHDFFRNQIALVGSNSEIIQENTDPLTFVNPPDTLAKSLEEPITLMFHDSTVMQVDGGLMLSDEYIDYLNLTMQEVILEEPVEEEKAVEFHAMIFPNPASDRTTLSIEFPEETEWMEVRLIDMHGKIIENQKKTHLRAGTFEQHFNVAHLVPGVYIVTIETADYKKSIRWIKQ